MSCCYPEGPQQLEKWDDENLMLFSERNSKTLPWGEQPQHQHRLGGHHSGKQFGREGPGSPDGHEAGHE